MIIFEAFSIISSFIASLHTESNKDTLLIVCILSACWIAIAIALYKLNQRYVDTGFWTRIIYNNLCKDKIQVTVTLQDNTELTGKLHLITNPDIIIIIIETTSNENYAMKAAEIKVLKVQKVKDDEE